MGRAAQETELLLDASIAPELLILIDGEGLGVKLPRCEFPSEESEGLETLFIIPRKKESLRRRQI